MEVTKALMDEHRLAERVLAVLLSSAEKLRRNERVSPYVFRKGVDFLINFIDKCHHRKEEGALFPAVEGRIKDPTILTHLLQEHEQGRRFVRSIASAVGALYSGSGGGVSKERARAEIARNAREYCDLLTHHVNMEDRDFFPACEEALSEEEKRAILKKFGEIERNEVGAGAHERYHSLAEELERLAA